MEVIKTIFPNNRPFPNMFEGAPLMEVIKTLLELLLRELLRLKEHHLWR